MYEHKETAKMLLRNVATSTTEKLETARLAENQRLRCDSDPWGAAGKKCIIDYLFLYYHSATFLLAM